MRVQARAEILIPATREVTFDVAVAETTLARILVASPPIPGVVRAEIEGGGPPRAGARRRATMTDKSVMVEEIVVHERPFEHRYRWAEKPPLPLRPILRTAEASWIFEASGGGTHLAWTYDFGLTTPLAYVPARAFAFLFSRWMQKGLGRLRSLIATGTGR